LLQVKYKSATAFVTSRMKNKKGYSLIGWAVFFLALAIVAAIFGFGAISGVSFTIAKWLTLAFVVLFIISIFMHLSSSQLRAS